MAWFLWVLVIVLILRYAVYEEWPSLRAYYYSLKLSGPWGWPGLGHVLFLNKLPSDGMVEYLLHLRDTYGRLFSFYMGTTLIVGLYEAEDVQNVLNSMAHSTKSIAYRPLKSWLQEGLLTSSGDKWKSRRKLLTPAFHFRILEDSLAGMNSNAARLVAKISKSKEAPIEIDELVCNCTLNVMTETAMGISLEEQKSEGVEYVACVKWITMVLLERIINQKFFKDYPFFWLPKGREFVAKLKTVHNFAEKVIRERRNSFYRKDSKPGKKRLVFLDCLLENEASCPGSWSDKDIREEVDTFMFEGHDTTAMTVIFALYSVGSHPDVQERVCRELDEIFEGNDRGMTRDDATKMVYLEKVIKETLRLYPSVPAFIRRLTTDCVLDDGVVIPAAANVMIPAITIHQNPKHFPDPEKFDPERFNDDLVAARHPFAYVPFSAGPRNCIGQKFAILELKAVLSSVFRKFKVKSVTKKGDFKLLPQLILKSTGPIVCQFFAR